MIISKQALDAVYTGFKTSFSKGLADAPTHWREVAMETKSGTGKEVYGWLGEMPAIREWIGDRIVNQLELHDFSIVNRTFEMTIGVKRTAIEDDTYGTFAPLMQNMGRQTTLFVDAQVFGLLAESYRMLCYDGQNFFDTDHPVKKSDGSVELVSNYQDGASAAWFLLDTSQAVKPLIWQERVPFQFQQVTWDGDVNVFLTDKYLYGVRGRGAAGLGLWQTAYMSKAPLNETNYEAARIAMSEFKADGGRSLNITPDCLVVPPRLEGAARRILQQQTANASDNIWAGSAELIITPYIA